MAAQTTEATATIKQARELLLRYRSDYDAAMANFTWPQPDSFNFALEWFDVLAQEHPERPALKIVEEDGRVGEWTYTDLSARSDQVAQWFTSVGIRRGDRVVVMLGNQIELWESILGLIKVGAVLIPASTLLDTEDLIDRVDRGAAKYVITRSVDAPKFDRVGGDFTKIWVRDYGSKDLVPLGWNDFALSADAEAEYVAVEPTPAADSLLLYFTSGTTALPKLVEHTQVSYPIGHLSTMYWLGLKPGDVHLNISSPGWAKHAWSNVFAPWLAGATVFVYNYTRFNAQALMQVMQDNGITTFCAPPTVWRMLIQADLSWLKTPPRELIGAGEPLNPEVIEQVRRAWGVTIRDGFGQTEMTAAIGNPPGAKVRDGSMGRPLPGYVVTLVDQATDEPGATEGEICLDLAHRPVALMAGYLGDAEKTSDAMSSGFYHTGDVGSVDADGYITYVGRADDVFKASDYRISPFELESVLVEHPAVAEAAVVPFPDALRLSVPKAYVVLIDGYGDNADTAKEIFTYTKSRLAPYKRIRRLEFVTSELLPKTISGKIRRVELRRRDAQLVADNVRAASEYRWEDFPGI
ncbi:AMP-dependent synthetase [Nakamurella antarctica]|uniref:AMP-dependent synthetase n=1 Tax=Nakamurella antarctica TaxID=1902245 RepID=A0A3G8ZIW9_9ACTN|nr:AMP-binding protein [Nakamurella antarctica]AZI57138.1 AMP-dependent synthetase [Nakamurella antarctica]